MLMKHDTIEFQVSDVSSEHLPSAHRHSFCCETTIHYGHFPIAIGKERTKLKLFPENACSKLDLMPTQMALFCRPCLGWNRRLVYLSPHKKKLAIPLLLVECTLASVYFFVSSSEIFQKRCSFLSSIFDLLFFFPNLFSFHVFPVH